MSKTSDTTAICFPTYSLSQPLDFGGTTRLQKYPSLPCHQYLLALETCENGISGCGSDDRFEKSNTYHEMVKARNIEQTYRHSYEYKTSSTFPGKVKMTKASRTHGLFPSKCFPQPCMRTALSRSFWPRCGPLRTSATICAVRTAACLASN